MCACQCVCVCMCWGHLRTKCPGLCQGILYVLQCKDGCLKHTRKPQLNKSVMKCSSLIFCFPLCFSSAEPHVWHPGPHTKWSHPWLALQHGGQNPIQLRVRLRAGRTQHPHMYRITWQRCTVGLPITLLQRCGDFLLFLPFCQSVFFFYYFHFFPPFHTQKQYWSGSGTLKDLGARSQCRGRQKARLCWLLSHKGVKHLKQSFWDAKLLSPDGDIVHIFSPLRCQHCI